MGATSAAQGGGVVTIEAKVLDVARRALELVAKATPGPWIWNEYAELSAARGPNKLIVEDDRTFIAFAREALPALASALLATQYKAPDEDAAVAEYAALKARVAALPPMTAAERRAQRLDWIYGQLACSTNHKPTRASFEELALERGWTAIEFVAWAAKKVWWYR